MKVASVCSSVGGLDLGLHRAGHRTVSFCEIDPWRRTVLARHWPSVPVLSDLKDLSADEVPSCDVVVGGTPCQDLSQAGHRAGLDGERSGLFHTFAQLRLDLFERHGCAWSLWENVEGARSSNQGRDFATVLASHVGADVAVPRGGWPGSGLVVGPWGTAEWRVLDAQFFGVPQRRRRVFVVGHLGADRPVEVLADAAGGPRDPSPSREARPDAPGGPTGGARSAGGAPARQPEGVAASLTARYGKGVDSDVSDGQVVIASALDTMRGGADDNDAQARHIVVGTLRSHPRPGSASPGAVVAFHATQNPITGPVSPSLGTNGYTGVAVEAGVRRLTPTECERLMGWPDGWTIAEGDSLVDVPQTWPGGPAPDDPRPDGRRYSACGDGVVAHVAEWIGHRFNDMNGL